MGVMPLDVVQPKQRDEGSSGGFRPHCDLGERYGSLTSSGDEVDDPLEIPTDHARMTGHRAESPDAVHERVDSLWTGATTTSERWNARGM